MAREPVWRRYRRFWGPDVAADFDEEIEFHLEARAAELIEQGVPPDRARRRAREEFGDLARARRECREIGEARLRRSRRAELLGSLAQDVRFAVRLFARSPGFFAVAVLTLGLGIGANSAIFGVVNALLLRPVPGVSDPDELVLLGRTEEGEGFDTFSFPDFRDYRAGAESFSGIAAWWSSPVHLGTGGRSERARAEVVSGDYFEVLGARPALGRTFLPGEDDAASPRRVVVLSHALWRTRFGGDPGVVGSEVRLNGRPFTVVGVAPEGFSGVEVGAGADLFVPIADLGSVDPARPVALEERGAMWLHLVGRLREGVTPGAAQAEVSAIARRLAAAFPETNRDRGIRVSPGIGFGPEARREVASFLGILLGVVGLVLLIACANVANLLLARSAARGREVAVRAAVGASRGRLVRQLATESLGLALLGGAVGLALAVASRDLLLRLPAFSADGPPPDLSLDWRVLGFTGAVALLSGLAFGLVPAFRASRPDLVSSLREGTPGAGEHRSRLRSALLVGQVALSLVLLVAAGLLLRTLGELYATERGFEADGLLIASVDAGRQGYDEEAGRRLFAELETRLGALPGVRAAALAYMVPLGGGGWDTRLFPAGAEPDPDDPGVRTDRNSVTPGYFEVMRMPIVRGRAFTPADRAGAPLVAVVNRALAERLWPGEDPLGRSFRPREGEAVEVVGVVEDAKYRSLTEERRAFVYFPFAQAYQPAMTLHVRTDGDPRALLPRLEREIRALDPDLPVYRAGTMGEWLDRSLGPQRTAATLVAGFGLLALLLASVGLYGSMAYAVSRRTREIGIRMALGARGREIARMVLRDALVVVGIGIGLGLAAALALGRVLEGRLFGVAPWDPATLAGVSLLLLAVGLLASQLPARRATRVDPIVALRHE